MSSKLIFLMSMILAACSSADAQDILRLTDGTSKVVKVLKVSPTEVEYKSFNNLEGPTYTTLKSDILSITYENGSTDTFTTAPASTPHPQTYNAYNVGYGQGLTASDRQLLALDMNSQTQINKWKKVRLGGWIGGGALMLAGGILIILDGDDGMYDDMTLGGVVMAGAGLVGAVTLNLVANSKLKKINDFNNMIIYETPILDFGNQKLTAGVDIMTNGYVHGLGLGLRLAF